MGRTRLFPLSFHDKGYYAHYQHRTFGIKAQLGSGAAMIVSWPPNLGTYFSSATNRYTGSVGPVNTDMLANTSVTLQMQAILRQSQSSLCCVRRGLIRTRPGCRRLSPSNRISPIPSIQPRSSSMISRRRATSDSEFATCLDAKSRHLSMAWNGRDTSR
jgi:hypothetical protein